MRNAMDRILSGVRTSWIAIKATRVVDVRTTYSSASTLKTASVSLCKLLLSGALSLMLCPAMHIDTAYAAKKLDLSDSDIFEIDWSDEESSCWLDEVSSIKIIENDDDDGTTTLKEGTDYTVVWYDEDDKKMSKVPTKEGIYTFTATGKGSYTGTLSEEIDVYDQFDLEYYDPPQINFLVGKVQAKPNVTLSRKSNGKTITLKDGTDYAFARWENEDEKKLSSAPTKAGTYYAYYKGKGKYKSETYADVTILSKTLKISEYKFELEDYLTAAQLKSGVVVELTAYHDGRNYPTLVQDVDFKILSGWYKDEACKTSVSVDQMSDGNTYYCKVQGMNITTGTTVATVSLEDEDDYEYDDEDDDGEYDEDYVDEDDYDDDEDGDEGEYDKDYGDESDDDSSEADSQEEESSSFIRVELLTSKVFFEDEVTPVKVFKTSTDEELSWMYDYDCRWSRPIAYSIETNTPPDVIDTWTLTVMGRTTQGQKTFTVETISAKCIDNLDVSVPAKAKLGTKASKLNIAISRTGYVLDDDYKIQQKTTTLNRGKDFTTSKRFYSLNGKEPVAMTETPTVPGMYGVLVSITGGDSKMFEVKLSAGAAKKCKGKHQLVKHNARKSSCAQTARSAFWQCKKCKQVFTSKKANKTANVKYKDALGHNYKTSKVYKSSTCELNGKAQEKCKRCKKTRKVAIAATGHNWNTAITIKQPTCTTSGLSTSTCKVCGKTKEDTLASLGHSFGSYVITLQPTCESSGTKQCSCARCGLTQTETISSLGGHKWDEGTIVKQATCTEDGSKSFSCTVCRKSKTESIGALGHQWSTYEVTKKPTISAAGSKTATCTRAGCGKTDTLAIAKLIAGSDQVNAMDLKALAKVKNKTIKGNAGKTLSGKIAAKTITSESGNTVTFSKSSGNASILVNKTGVVTVKASLSKGTYSVKAKATCGKKSKTITVKIKLS